MAAPKIFLGKLGLVDDLDIMWVENFDEIALSRSVKEIEAIKVLTAGRDS